MAIDSTTSPTADISLGDDPLAGKQTGIESALSTYAGPYVTDMLGTGQALADLPYEPYEGPLTAGASDLQTDAFSGIAGLTIPTDEMGTFTPMSVTDEGFDLTGYMNPYFKNVVQDQITDLKKQADIRRIENAARMTSAGSYGGSRQAVLEGMFEEKLLDDISRAINTGNVQAYNEAIKQFNLEQDKEKTAQDTTNLYGMNVIDKLASLGGTQQAIEQAGITADKEQFAEEMNYPYKQVQFMQSLLQNLPLETQQYSYTSPSQLADAAGGAQGLLQLYNLLFGGGGNTLIPGGMGTEA
jgi:hypothetical protein